ncbi:lipoyl synthase [Alkalibaculum sp. M08DMB]|uniref:Lipoyl synthase n=1 Tax=Alkalibaculum sporogenes TaxID=2655001 RepID=A0A6A7KBH2_9FIRM|nr:lipoyl synthase [Alkalibaculum sporogenes]MPW26537.1 lipoyl synthase [Alkalibaculum sporogenes]
MIEKKPEWLKLKIRDNKNDNTRRILNKYDLNTVCNEAACPNQFECFNRGTATFLILGKNCTRNCTFCNISKYPPEIVNDDEPRLVAMAVKELKLNHVVITSVTRDDLEDGGASQFANTILEIKRINTNITIEVLIPDFQGNEKALEKVIDAQPDIINHNVETTKELYSLIRPMAIYNQSLKLLKDIKKSSDTVYTKSGFMLGLGENDKQVCELLRDLRDVGCDILTIGQYLQPSKLHYPIVEYLHPDKFKEYEIKAYKLGFKYVASNPLVRSSYRAEDGLLNLK